MDDIRKPLKYERPHLLDLFDTTAVGTFCETGGSYSIDCSGFGQGACGDNGCVTGGFAGTSCGYGASVSVRNCVNGGSPGGGPCSTGTGAGAGNCVAGPST